MAASRKTHTSTPATVPQKTPTAIPHTGRGLPSASSNVYEKVLSREEVAALPADTRLFAERMIALGMWAYRDTLEKTR